MTDFQYVVERQEQERICFLSGRERHVPKKIDVCDAVYDLSRTSGLYQTLNKIRSNRGVGGLANLSPRTPKCRLEQGPEPATYNLIPVRSKKQSYVPFGNSGKEYKWISRTPGPGTYILGKQCRKTKMIHSFGGRAKMDPVVEAQCIDIPTDTCAICKKLCVGDYWHRIYETFLCLKCMRIERKKQTKFTRAELDTFKKMRNCSFMHQHEGTTAAIRLMPKNLICMKFRKENYLELFFDKYI